jgi:hypothetical protein
MAVGQNANMGFSSYLLVGRELTFNTYNTCTAALEFQSASFTMKREIKQLDAVRKSRSMADKIGLGRAVEGSIDWAMGADDNASNYLLQNAMGGGVVSSATAAGDTAGGGLFEHVLSINGFDATYSSLCFNHRKGDGVNGKVFEYQGGRVNEFSLKAEIDEALAASAKLILCDATSGGTDQSALATNNNGQVPLVFTNMRFSVENTFASLTAASFWHVQSIELGVNNSLKSDSSSRRIGSDVLQVLPPGVVAYTLNISMRFDTLTAYAAMMSETQMAAQVEFLQPNTSTGSKFQQGIKFDFPRVYISDAGDPEIGGPDEIIKADVTFLVLQDDSSATGYACKATVRNAVSTYA